nr:MAG TPA: hypothetical protein [Caudoviricetes sp.]
MRRAYSAAASCRRGGGGAWAVAWRGRRVF